MTNSRFLFDVEVYTGQDNEDETVGIDCGKSGNVVIRLLQSVPREQRYKVYVDNYFASPKLLLYLAQQGIFCVATVRPNRVKNMDIVIPTEKQMKKNGRGTVCQLLRLFKIISYLW